MVHGEEMVRFVFFGFFRIRMPFSLDVQNVKNGPAIVCISVNDILFCEQMF